MFKLMFILLWLPLSNADNPCSFSGNIITCKGIQQEDFFDQLYRNEKFVLNNDVNIIEIMNSNYSRIESFYNPTSLFSRIRVSHLTIGNSSIETIATSAFKDLDLLRTLNLANNYIKDISFIENIPSLKMLDLGFNKMSVFNLNSLSNNFEHLIMRGNKIKEIVPSKEFKSCSYLDLSYNRLKNFNEALLNYFFHSLDLSHNRIRNVSLMDEFPLSKKTTDRFKRIVNLEGNNVTFLESIENKPFTCSQLFLSNIPIHLPPRLKIFEKFSVRNSQIGLLNRTKLDIGRLKYDPNLTIDFFNSSITDIADIFFWNVQCSLLNLSHNNLSILDKIIFSGSAIEHLDLSFSEIGFISTDFFMNLKPFPTVNLKGNYLKNVKDICKYTKFSVIDLSYNMMDSIGPDSFDGCSELHTLHISNSRISKIEPGTFSKLASLRKLDLSYNRFTLVDRNTFSNLRNIEEIDISGNYLEIIGTNAFSKSIVSDLRFFNTTIGIIKHKAFNGLSKLRILNISGTGIKNVEDYAFFDLPALKTIDMSNNNITIISSNTFSNLPISNLLLNGNKIKIIQSRAFDNMYFMKFLNLSLLGIQEMESFAFSSLKQLDTIDLRGNNIAELKTNVFSDLFVSRIHLSGNNITNLAPINNYVAVTTLSLQFNGVLERHAIANAHLREVIFIDSLITFLKKDCFRGLYALESLNLINTEISAYETGFLNGLYHVTHLDVQILLKNTHVIQNNLFADLRSIKILQLSNLNLCVVEPEAFSGLWSLEELYLGDNRFQSLKGNIFDNLKLLKILDLSNSSFESIDIFDILKYTKSLNSLRLSFGKLTNLTLNVQEEYSLSNLRRLFLDNNFIRNFSSGIFHKLTQLEILHLQNNKLESIPYETFRYSNSLDELRLDGNNLKSLSPGIFGGLNNLTMLNLSHNVEVFQYANDLSLKVLNNLQKLNLEHTFLTDDFNFSLGIYFTGLREVYLNYNYFSCQNLFKMLKYFQKTGITCSAVNPRYDVNNIDGIICSYIF